MDDVSIFSDKELQPNQRELSDRLGASYNLWQQIEDIVVEQYPAAKKEWNFPGKKYGWSYRIKDKKRAIIYLLPREAYFKVAFVFGDKAVEKIMQSNVNDAIKKELQSTKKYVEGRGICFDANEKSLKDIKVLVTIKLQH